MKHAFKEKNNFKDYYDILEISHNSTDEEISEAYQRAKNIYLAENIALHSVMREEECKSMAQLVEEAYSILGEPGKRNAYDSRRGFKKVEVPEMPRSVKESRDIQHTIYKEAQVSKIAAINRFALDYAVDPEMEEQIESCEVFSGEFLRQIREYKNVNIPRMSNMTKISKTYIKNLEDENIEALPALAYVRGFVYQYAKTLKLNPNYVANSYIARFRTKI